MSCDVLFLQKWQQWQIISKLDIFWAYQVPDKTQREKMLFVHLLCACVMRGFWCRFSGWTLGMWIPLLLFCLENGIPSQVTVFLMLALLRWIFVRRLLLGHPVRISEEIGHISYILRLVGLVALRSGSLLEPISVFSYWVCYWRFAGLEFQGQQCQSSNGISQINIHGAWVCFQKSFDKPVCW